MRILRSIPGHRGSSAAGLLALGIAGAMPAVGGTAAAPPTLTIAVIGDYGSCTDPDTCDTETAVADMVHGWRPDAIVTVGDNTYESGTAAEIAVAQAPYAADVRAGNFYPIAGNHDWGNSCSADAIQPSVQYFGRPPAYVAHLGQNLVDLFATDMNCGNPLGYVSESKQADQYRAQVAASTATWKVGVSHQPFYSSGKYGVQEYTHWAILPPVDLYLSGHDHDFEHLVERGRDFVVNGVGGKSIRPVCAGGCIAGSVWHDDQHSGAVRMTVTPSNLKVEFIAARGGVLHTFTIAKTGVSTSAPLGADPGVSQLPGIIRLPLLYGIWFFSAPVRVALAVVLVALVVLAVAVWRRRRVSPS